jgi:hypothetical protein
MAANGEPPAAGEVERRLLKAWRGEGEVLSDSRSGNRAAFALAAPPGKAPPVDCLLSAREAEGARKLGSGVDRLRAWAWHP